MNVRRAIAADADAIAEVHVSTWRVAYRGQIPDTILDSLDVSLRAGFWRAVLSANHGVFVALSEARVVGFCSLIPSRDEDANRSTVAEIAALYVSPRHWRRGVARTLCSRATETAHAAGFSSMTLWVLSSNHPAISFYEAIGFAVDGASKSERIVCDTTLEELRMRRAIQMTNK